MATSDAASPADDVLFTNGIDGDTGAPAFAPFTIAEFAARCRDELHVPLGFTPAGAVRGIEDLANDGWAIVVPRGFDPAVRRALDVLCARRAQQAGRLYQELDFDPETDTFRTWLERHQVSPGNVDHNQVPRYLLLLGPPDLIPFEVQYLLSIEYGVGRLAFDTPAEYAAYAASIVAYETAAEAPTAREACFWGPRRDPATELSSADLLDPLVKGWGRSSGVAEEARFRASLYLADDATKSNLLAALHRPTARPPTLLFTASHGAVWPSGHVRQAGEQGALLAQEWFPGDSVAPESRIAAADIGDGARIHGLVAFFFACYSAATPARDSFPRTRTETPRKLAPAPFLSALPRRLLAHPGGGALGVIGHVDRAWGCSMKRLSSIPQIAPFREGLLGVLRGSPLGNALSVFSRRYAVLSASLLSEMDRGGAPLTDAELASRWLERNDTQGYVLLGDPGVSVRRDLTA